MKKKTNKDMALKAVARFCDRHKQKPNIAHVVYHWKGGIGTFFGLIVLDMSNYKTEPENGKCVPFIKDDEVLYYCNGIDEFLALFDANTEDFEIDNLLAYEKI